MTDRYLNVLGHEWDELPPRWLLGAVFGTKIQCEEYTHAYSDNNPADLNETVAKCLSKEWRPLITQISDGIVAEHHLEAHRSLEEGFAFCGGWVHPKARGRTQRGMRADEWLACRQVFEAWGFPKLFCVAFVDNPAAVRWIVEVCDFWRAGQMLHAVTRGGEPQDIVLFSQREEDLGECIEQAQVAFPDGEFERDDSAT